MERWQQVSKGVTWWQTAVVAVFGRYKITFARGVRGRVIIKHKIEMIYVQIKRCFKQQRVIGHRLGATIRPTGSTVRINTFSRRALAHTNTPAATLQLLTGTELTKLGPLKL